MLVQSQFHSSLIRPELGFPNTNQIDSTPRTRCTLRRLNHQTCSGRLNTFKDLLRNENILKAASFWIEILWKKYLHQKDYDKIHCCNDRVRLILGVLWKTRRLRLLTAPRPNYRRHFAPKFLYIGSMKIMKKKEHELQLLRGKHWMI